MKTDLSEILFKKAETLIPGGVNSPVRACRSVGCSPLFIASAQGAEVTSVDGDTYIDFVQSWGPMLLGHSHPRVNAAVHAAVNRGSSYGAPCPDEVRLAQLIREFMPHVEMVRMVNSGTEATMSALRLARAYTGRDCVIKFEGCYHGHADAFLASAGSGVATLSIPGTPGVPEAVVRHTMLAPYNNLEAVRSLFHKKGEEIAAVIVEPVAGNMGLVPPVPGFLEGLRTLCDENRALLIFDEVITGFRVALGGAAVRFGVTPDLVSLGKIIGGGFPVGAYGGKGEIMERVAPSGDVYQAGTLAGNPVAMAAGIATLETLEECDYGALEARVAEFAREYEAIFRAKGASVCLNVLASMFTLFTTPGPVTDYASARKQDCALYAAIYRQMRDRGIYLAPSGFECAMVGFAHTEEHFEKTLDAARAVTLPV